MSCASKSSLNHGIAAEPKSVVAINIGWMQMTRKYPLFSMAHLGIFCLLPNLVCADPVEVPVGRYEVKAETLLPNLQNNLRYTTTFKKQCLHKQDAATLFPILKQVSFVGCQLLASSNTSDVGKFLLVCDNPQAAGGNAQFEIEEKFFNAVLNVKMGGKNMKFSQRVTGNRLSDCK